MHWSTQLAFYWHPSNPDSSIELPYGEAWFITPDGWRALHHSSRYLTLCMVILTFTLYLSHLADALTLLCGCLAMETISWSSWWNGSYADIASRAGLELSIECCNRGHTVFKHFSTRWSHSASLCDLPLRCRAVVAPRRFHFTITALRVDRGSFSSAELWRTDLLERWHLMTVPCWKSLVLLKSSFYCQCLSIEVACLCVRFYTLVSNRCAWNSGLHKFSSGVHILLYM
jgi:hypothetical protein